MDVMNMKAHLVCERVKKNLGSGELAVKLGLHPNTYRNKEKDPLKFTLAELIKLKDILGTNTIDDIFK